VSKWGPLILNWERLRKGEALELKEVRKLYAALATVSLEGQDKIADRSLKQGSFTKSELTEFFGLKEAESPWFETLAMSDHDVGYLRALLARHGGAGIKLKPRHRLSTIHAAKGAEADHVVLLTDMPPKVRESAERTPDDERRVWYVAVTRVRQTLTLVGDDNPFF
jgi:hypothetical protein